MEEQKRPVRKPIRMPEFDYNSNGAYFITFCTKDRKQLLSKISVGATIGRPPDVVLTDYGRFTEEAIQKIENIYPSVHVDNYVIMPNHVHLLLFLYCDDGRAMGSPRVGRCPKDRGVPFLAEERPYGIADRPTTERFHNQTYRSLYLAKVVL